MDLKKNAVGALFFICAGALTMTGMRIVDLILPKPMVTYMVCIKAEDTETHCDDFDPSFTR